MRKKISVYILVILFAILSFLTSGALKANATVTSMCASDYLTCADPTDGIYASEKCISEWNCGGAGTDKSTCMLTRSGPTPLIDTSATIFSDKIFCLDSVITRTRLCSTSNCYQVFYASAFSVFDGQACTVRKIKTGDSTKLLEDAGFWNHSARQCVKCAPAGGWLDPLDGVTKYNLQMAICGDSSGIFLDNNTGECNGAGATKLFSEYCGAESYCDGKAYKEACSNGGSCGACNASGNCDSTICVPAAPTLTITPASQEGAPGELLTYSVKIENNSRGSCAESFNLTATSPGAGWTVTLPASTSPTPCGEQTVTLTIQSPGAAVTGSYTVTVTATGSTSGLNASGAAIYVIPPPPACNTFTALPSSVASGSSTTLSWNASNATNGTITNDIDLTVINVTGNSGFESVTPSVPPVGSITYTLNLVGKGGITNNACSVTVTVCVANYDTVGCFSAPNACGQTNSALVPCDGVCPILPVPDLPAFYGNACQSSANACGVTNSGTKDCSDVCVDGAGNPVVAPPNPPACTATNACGASNNGYECAGPGICNVVPPPLPPNYGNDCTMTNACGASNTGTILCDGISCSVSAPLEPPNYGNTCNSLPNTCGITNTGTIQCDGITCSAVTPPDPPGVGLPCTATNSCGMTADGIIQCDLSCNAVLPPVVTGGLVPCGRYCDDLATTFIDEKKPCDLCAALYMLKKTINLAMELAVGIAVFVIIIGGLLYAFSSGNPGRMETARSGIAHAVSGVALIFTAWVLIAVLLQVMGYGGIANWNQVNCSLQT